MDSQKFSTVRDIMTTTVLYIRADTSLTTAFKILNQEGYSGLPVVDENEKFVGLITIRHLTKFYSSGITTDVPLHLPTLITLLQKIKLYSKDKELLGKAREQIVDLKVQDVMSVDPQVLHPESPIETAVAMLQKRRIDPIPIISENNDIVGIVTRSNLLKLLKGYNIMSENLPHQDSVPYFSENVKNFMAIFSKEFLLVSKMRTYYWLLFSLVFGLLGFVLSYIFILKVDF